MIKLKAIIAFAIVTAAAVFTSCSQKGPRTIENPIINYSNTTTIDIVGVELTDSCTILTVQATFVPNNWSGHCSHPYSGNRHYRAHPVPNWQF